MTVTSDGTRLQDELGGLGDEHKVALDVWVGHGDGTTAADLFGESGDDRAA